MKTEQTIAIEKALGYYDPAKMCGLAINKSRARHIAYEVPVECGTTRSGIIDAVRISEYFSGVKHQHACYWQLHKKDGIQRAAPPSNCAAGFTLPDTPRYCEQPGCVWKRVVSEGTPDILVTCFEIKVTKTDFKNISGHNFVGNLNYYVVPVSLYPEIKDMVPEDIGIIAYYDGTQEPAKERDARGFTSYPLLGLRRKKECQFREIMDAEQKWLILSVLKRKRKR